MAGHARIAVRASEWTRACLLHDVHELMSHQLRMARRRASLPQKDVAAAGERVGTERVGHLRARVARMHADMAEVLAEHRLETRARGAAERLTRARLGQVHGARHE